MLFLHNEEHLTENSTRLRSIKAGLKFWKDWLEHFDGIFIAKFVGDINQDIPALSVLPPHPEIQAGDVSFTGGCVESDIEDKTGQRAGRVACAICLKHFLRPSRKAICALWLLTFNVTNEVAAEIPMPHPELDNIAQPLAKLICGVPVCDYDD